MGEASWVNPIVRLQFRASGSGGVTYIFDGLTTGTTPGGLASSVGELGEGHPDQVAEIPVDENWIEP